MKYKAICFDIDGTLYSEKHLKHVETKLALLRPFECKRYRKLRARLREVQDIRNEDKPFREKEAQVYSELFPQYGDAQKAREHLDKRYYSLLQRIYSHLDAKDGVRETFEKIKRKGIKIALFSDWPLYDKPHLLGLDDLCDCISNSDNDGYLKPSVHAFEKLLYNLKLEACDVLYVGDSYKKDVLGSVACGMDGILISDIALDKSKYPKATEVFTSWKDFDIWLNSVMED